MKIQESHSTHTCIPSIEKVCLPDEILKRFCKNVLNLLLKCTIVLPPQWGRDSNEQGYTFGRNVPLQSLDPWHPDKCGPQIFEIQYSVALSCLLSGFSCCTGMFKASFKLITYHDSVLPSPDPLETCLISYSDSLIHVIAPLLPIPICSLILIPNYLVNHMKVGDSKINIKYHQYLNLNPTSFSPTPQNLISLSLSTLSILTILLHFKTFLISLNLTSFPFRHLFYRLGIALHLILSCSLSILLISCGNHFLSYLSISFLIYCIFVSNSLPFIIQSILLKTSYLNNKRRRYDMTPSRPLLACYYCHCLHPRINPSSHRRLFWKMRIGVLGWYPMILEGLFQRLKKVEGYGRGDSDNWEINYGARMACLYINSVELMGNFNSFQVPFFGLPGFHHFWSKLNLLAHGYSCLGYLKICITYFWFQAKPFCHSDPNRGFLVFLGALLIVKQLCSSYLGLVLDHIWLL
ncbi:hypothetical protein VP01_453g5 [Puccinia sorghi]|uniref:Uncharacterized protein n=1 Tax=Puccinia sorghi TaxID=27349 RepID=A0A0L6UNU2_9BASI|nr:hypothetical protein VP01_453g5 [Puccinia sorghi]